MRKIVLLLAFLLFFSAAFAGTVDIIFFYGEGCPHCAAAERHIESIAIKHPDMNVQYLNIANNVDLILELYDIYGVPQEWYGAVPILFVGDKYIMGDTPIIGQIEDEYYQCMNSNCSLLLEKEGQGNGASDSQLAEPDFSLSSLVILAVADAVNPCELAVLIILMTAILTQYPEKKRKALQAGLAFSLAIFLMYSFFGLLIITGFKFLSSALDISNVYFFGALAVLAIILGILNLKDAISYGGGGFIMEVPQKWRPKMKALIKGTTSVRGAFIVGLIVSFFLTPCTAGPYFVATGMLSAFSWLTAMPYFFLYMLIFISPMIAITLITYGGFAAVEDMGGWRERNLKKLHLVAGIIMLAIGLLMLAWAFGIVSF